MHATYLPIPLSTCNKAYPSYHLSYTIADWIRMLRHQAHLNRASVPTIAIYNTSFNQLYRSCAMNISTYVSFWSCILSIYVHLLILPSTSRLPLTLKSKHLSKEEEGEKRVSWSYGSIKSYLHVYMFVMYQYLSTFLLHVPTDLRNPERGWWEGSSFGCGRRGRSTYLPAYQSTYLRTQRRGWGMVKKIFSLGLERRKG